MKKWILLLIAVLVIPSLVGGALEMCDDTVRINTNCTMVTPVISCTTYTYQVFNVTGQELENDNLTQLNGTIYYFNFTHPEGNYVIKLCDGTTREVYVEPEEDSMLVGILVFSPLALAFLLMFIAHSLGSTHTIIKLFLMLLSPIFIFVTWHFGVIALAELYGMTELIDAIGFTTNWFTAVLVAIIFYFFGYLLWAMVDYIMKRKKERIEY